MADLYEQLTQQQLAIATKRIVRRQLAPSTSVLSGSGTSTIDPTTPGGPGGVGAAEGANSQTFLVTENSSVQRESTPPLVASPPWPPDRQFPPFDNNAEAHVVSKTKIVGGDGNASYYVSVMLLKFDTSSLPDTAAITGASIKFTMDSKRSMDNRSLTADWHTWTTPSQATDWTAAAVTGALSGVPLSEIPNSGTFEIQLENAPANVSKTGNTTLRFTISGGAPDNIVPNLYTGQSYSLNDVVVFGLGYELGTWLTVPAQSPVPGVAPRLTVRYA